MKSIVWTIAGSDPSGGAGIELDIKILQQFAVHGCALMTASTVQNSEGVFSVTPSSSSQLQQQLHVLANDMPANVIKLGMLADESIVLVLAEFLQHYSGLVVCDPVLLSSSGMPLLTQQGLAALKNSLLPCIDVLTPNITEAEILLNCKIKTDDDKVMAANKLLQLGVKNCIIKGGHSTDNTCKDYWSNGHEHAWIHAPRQNKQIHGTGCCFATAIAANLALAAPIKEALVLAKMLVNKAIRRAYQPGKGAYYLNVQQTIYQQSDVPSLTQSAQLPALNAFSRDHSPIDFYPIVANRQWLEKCIKQGVKTIQLRIKDKSYAYVEQEIKLSVTLAKRHQVQLYINDYWQLAIKYNAYGVHLGQNDLQTADITAIQTAGLRLGISTHCHYEVASALAYQPSYIAIGPIYATDSKAMMFAPQGIKQLHYWQRLLNYPLVAIGGINLSRLDEVLATGVRGIAVISAITCAADTEKTIKQFLAKINNEAMATLSTANAS